METNNGRRTTETKGRITVVLNCCAQEKKINYYQTECFAKKTIIAELCLERYGAENVDY